MPEEKRMLTMAEAARRLSVHPNTLRLWADTGRVPVVRRPGGGGYRKFDPDTIERVAREMGIETSANRPTEEEMLQRIYDQGKAIGEEEVRRTGDIRYEYAEPRWVANRDAILSSFPSVDLRLATAAFRDGYCSVLTPVQSVTAHIESTAAPAQFVARPAPTNRCD